MNDNKISLYIMVLLAALLTACSGTPKEMKTTDPHMSVSEYAMLHEVVKIGLENVASDEEVTIDFGDGIVETGRNKAFFTHAYAHEGDYTLKAQTATGISLTADIHICSLPALSVAMQQFKDPSYRKVWVMAHRAHTHDKTIPENSLPAIEAAVATGAEILECDVRQTKDGVLVICHDETINATTTGQGRIADMTYDEILQYNLRDRAGNPTDEKMPTLEAYLVAVRGRAYVDIDKCTGQGIFKEVVDVVRRTGMMEAVFFYSGVEEGTREVLGVTEDANIYPWVGGHKLLEELPRTFFVQTAYFTEGRSPSLGDAVEMGMIPSVCLLWVLDQTIPEYALDDKQLDELFNIFPTTRMIQTDVPAELIAALQKKGLR
ncbi:glycerophosphodiester phosphodiesterase family protein [uncultured Bacteroides sp.]|uniref:glycerophosphodiester phosphodiesterase family protein n=1 Tax=uncultured Bacteroides sp. TaxID=162156 RepID=UPI00261BD336|nr:glycerophosphodiester phosphodiesterase family protein [uncultured Bacteroides sp.]